MAVDLPAETEAKALTTLTVEITAFGVFTSVKFRVQIEGQHQSELYGQCRTLPRIRGGDRREKALHRLQER